MRNLSSVVKAYDVRGVVPDELDEGLVRDLGAAFVDVLALRPGNNRVVVGHDMRPSSPGLVAAFTDGVTGQGVDVVQIGLAATDQLYYASGILSCPGAMFTASHNPARYNGVKLCRAGAAPVGQDSGLREIRRLLESSTSGAGPPGRGPATRRGTTTRRDLLDDYAAHLRSLADLPTRRRVRVVVDAGNGMAGHTAPAVLGALPIDLVPLFFELDGTFPNHDANPIEPDNLRDLQAAVRKHRADLGLAFDGDADRCFVVDERGEPVSPSVITALVAARELAREPGATVIHNLITSRAVPEVIAEHGGVAVRTRVGHSFIKEEMARTGAIFGGEHSAHYYFRDFWRADTGMLAALHVIAALAEQDRPLSALLGGYTRYVASGELNRSVADQERVTERVRAAFSSRDGTEIDELDGMTVSTPRWWFNLRPSNTEPLLRLNVEARDTATMERVRDEVLTILGEVAAE